MPLNTEIRAVLRIGLAGYGHFSGFWPARPRVIENLQERLSFEGEFNEQIPAAVPVVAAFWSIWYKSFCPEEIMETES